MKPFATALKRLLRPRSSAQSAAKNFLNCTKNTELTGNDFALTVTFALIQKQNVPAAKAALRTLFNN